MESKPTKSSMSFLFKEKVGSTLMGLSTIIDITDYEFPYNTFKSSEDADRKALESDWEMIGQDMEKAINSYRKSRKI